jgi:hypothetical protein
MDPGSPLRCVRDDGVFFADVQVLKNWDIVIGQSLRSQSVRSGVSKDGSGGSGTNWSILRDAAFHGSSG